MGTYMMGDGFGGGTLNLVEAAHMASFVEGVEADFSAFYRRELETYQITSVSGVGIA